MPNRTNRFYQESARRRHAATVRRAQQTGTLSSVSIHGMLANRGVRRRLHATSSPRRSAVISPMTTPTTRTNASMTRPFVRSPRARRIRVSPSPEPITNEPPQRTHDADGQLPAHYEQVVVADPTPLAHLPYRPETGSGRPAQRLGGESLLPSLQIDRSQPAFHPGLFEMRDVSNPIQHSTSPGWTDDDLEDGEILNTPIPISSPTRRTPMGSTRRSPEEQLRPLREAVDELQRSLSGNPDVEDIHN